MIVNRLACVWSRCAAVLMSGLLAGVARGQGTAVTPADDAYHFAAWNHPPHESTYTEWLWNWAQCSTPQVAFEMGVFIGGPAAAVSIAAGGVRTVFGPGQYRLVHTQWAYDAADRVFYPTQSRLTATNDSARLEVDMHATATAPLVGDLPAPLKNLIIYEQPADFDGRLWSRNGGGSWGLSVVFSGPGFKEYTAKHY